MGDRKCENCDAVAPMWRVGPCQKCVSYSEWRPIVDAKSLKGEIDGLRESQEKIDVALVRIGSEAEEAEVRVNDLVDINLRALQNSVVDLEAEAELSAVAINALIERVDALEGHAPKDGEVVLTQKDSQEAQTATVGRTFPSACSVCVHRTLFTDQEPCSKCYKVAGTPKFEAAKRVPSEVEAFVEEHRDQVEHIINWLGLYKGNPDKQRIVLYNNQTIIERALKVLLKRTEE